MRPEARVAAAIEILDRILTGEPAEKALTLWGRANRFAGSKDRAAIRDQVYGALRRRRSAAWVGGADSGRGLMIGALSQDGVDLSAVFTGEGHAPAPLGPDEGRGDPATAPETVRADMPDWLWDRLVADHGAAATVVAAATRMRGPVFLRVNTLCGDAAQALAALAGEGILAEAVTDVPGALRVTQNAQKIQQSQAYLGGLVELQDASSQAAVLRLPLTAGMRVLDYCAGGGGKALAMAARLNGTVFAHDAAPARMADIPARAARAGARIRVIADPAAAGACDLTLVDAPCSGSGTWRRTPDAKWRLTPGDLDRLTALQAKILHTAAATVAPGGALAYATCSVLAAENRAVAAALAGWRLDEEMQRLPGPDGDGFYLALLRRS